MINTVQIELCNDSAFIRAIKIGHDLPDLIANEAGSIENLAVLISDPVRRNDRNYVADGVTDHGPPPARGGVQGLILGLGPDCCRIE